MSGQTGKWREEQVLIICPGSQTTLAQLGCNELTLPAHRFPTRMFRDEDSDDWRPFRTYKRKKEGEAAGDDGWERVEDVESAEGAVYPIQGMFVSPSLSFSLRVLFAMVVGGVLTTPG